MTEITLYDLPKISLNDWYSSAHWSKRKKIKDNYYWLIKSQLKNFGFLFTKDKTYTVNYVFFFKSKPLDASNCSAMVKLIEDCLFEDDKYDIIERITIESNKGNQDLVYIKINETHY